MKEYSELYEGKIGVILTNLGTPNAPSKKALKKYGVIKGGSKGVIRLLKCHPYSNSYGIDEV